MSTESEGRIEKFVLTGGALAFLPIPESRVRDFCRHVYAKERKRFESFELHGSKISGPVGLGEPVILSALRKK